MKRRILLVLVGGVLAVLISAVIVDVVAGRRLHREYARLEQRFGVLDARGGFAPEVPDEDNSARVIRAASILVLRGPGRRNYTEMRTALGPYEKASASAPIPQDVRAFIDANTQAVHVAELAVTRSQANWEADYLAGEDLPRFLLVRGLSDATYVSALQATKEGHADEASRYLVTGLAVASSLRNERSLIAQLIRISVAAQQFEGVRRLVADAEPPAAALAELARALRESGATDPMQVGLLGELRYGNNEILKMERTPKWRLLRPFVRLARRDYLLEMERLLDLQAGPRPHPPYVDRSARWPLDWRKITLAQTAGLQRAIDSGDDFTTMRGVAEAGVALRRYRLEHGAYPDDLASLVPAYLPKVPLNAGTGRPPAYARSGAGFTLRGLSARQEAAASAALEWTVAR
jgi:hypothetical protein